MMNNFRRTVIGLGVSFFAALALTACSGGSTAVKPETGTASVQHVEVASTADKNDANSNTTENQNAAPSAEAPADEGTNKGEDQGKAKTDDRPSDMIDAKGIEAGSVLVFGNYEQDGDEENGPEPIDWIVLENEGGNLFLLSRYVLDNQPFLTDGKGTWDISSLRTWLNCEFYEAAFSDEERQLIQETNLTADLNPQTSMDPGADTQDNVFLLSISEAEQYFLTDRERQCWSTPFAVAQGAYTDEPYELTDGWMLRSPGGDLESVSSVNYNGAIHYNGIKSRTENAVRPALRVSGGTFRVLKDGTDERQLQMVQDEADAFNAFGQEPADASGRAFDQAGMAGASAWSTVVLGAFEQDGDTGNGAEPIEWIVLSNDGDSLLLVSRYALDCRPYHVVPGNITWEESSLRAWLNSDFYNSAFSEAERDRILTTDVPAEANPDYETDPGNATQDRIFMLSISEAQTYFGASKMGDDSRQCEATPYAKAQGAQTRKKDDLRCYYWLRNPSRGTTGRSSSFAAYVDSGGSIQTVGDATNSLRTYSVRPAIRVNIAP